MTPRQHEKKIEACHRLVEKTLETYNETIKALVKDFDPEFGESKTALDCDHKMYLRDLGDGTMCKLEQVVTFEKAKKPDNWLTFQFKPIYQIMPVRYRLCELQPDTLNIICEHFLKQIRNKKK